MKCRVYELKFNDQPHISLTYRSLVRIANQCKTLSPCRLVVRHEAMILLKSHSGTRRCDTTRGDDPATITFKTLHFQQPSYLAALVPRYVPTRSLRSASSLLICAPSRKTAMAESRSFSSVASDFWIGCHVILRPFLLFLLSGRDSNIIFFQCISWCFLKIH